MEKAITGSFLFNADICSLPLIHGWQDTQTRSPFNTRKTFYGSAIVAFLEEALWDLRLPVILQLCATEFKRGLEVNKYQAFVRSG